MNFILLKSIFLFSATRQATKMFLQNVYVILRKIVVHLLFFTKFEKLNHKVKESTQIAII